MTLQHVIEVMLVVAATLLLAKDLRRTRLDSLRRPWWLAVPAAVLVWEVGRGWRVTPRCHLREAGIASFAGSLLLAVAGLGLEGRFAAPLLAASAAAALLGVGLLWRSRLREPQPWRAADRNRYERRSVPRA